MRIEQVCVLLECSRSLVVRLVKQGELHPTKQGRVLMFEEKEVLALKSKPRAFGASK